MQGGVVTAWLSVQLADNGWDGFLESTRQGQFQQTSLWARAKVAEGWQPIRVVMTRDGKVIGGYQVMAKGTRFGSIGYISKGPVLDLDRQDLAGFMLDTLIATAKTHHLRAVIVQPPDEDGCQQALLRGPPFFPNCLTQVIDATLVVDLSAGMEKIREGMRRTTILELKRAQKRGVTIREGAEQDLEAFFRMMVATCDRQQTRPSPGSVEILREIWKTFHAEQRIRLSLAECEGEAVAGAICLTFGNRVTFWKKGWSGAYRERHPNQLVMFDAIEWSQQRGYKRFDCLAMSRDTAETLLRGEPPTEEQKKRRDFFLLGYGGAPVLLPEARVYFSNGAARFLYRRAVSSSRVRAMLRRAARRLN